MRVVPRRLLNDVKPAIHRLPHHAGRLVCADGYGHPSGEDGDAQASENRIFVLRRNTHPTPQPCDEEVKNHALRRTPGSSRGDDGHGEGDVTDDQAAEDRSARQADASLPRSTSL